VMQGDGAAGRGHRAAEGEAVGDPAAVSARAVVVHFAAVEGQDGGVGTGRTLRVEDAAAGGDCALTGRGVAVHLSLVQGHRPVVHDPSAAGVAGGVVVHLALVQDGVAAVSDAACGDGRPFLVRPRLGHGNGGWVAVDLALVQREMAGGPWRVAVAGPTGNPASVRRGVAVDLAAIERDRSQQVLDAAAAAGVRGVVAVHFAVVEGQDAPGVGEVQIVAVGDPAPDKPVRGIFVHLAPIQRRRAQDVHDPPTAEGVVVLRAGRLLVFGYRAVVERQLGHARCVQAAATAASA